MRRAHRRPGVPVADPTFQAGDPLLVQYPAFQKLFFVGGDGIDGFPRRFFSARAIFVARVAEGMAEESVSIHVEEVGPLTLPAALGRPPHRVARGQHIHTIDDLCVHAIVGKTGRALGHVADAHHLVV